MIKNVVITQLNIIDAPGGNIMHAIKKTSVGYAGFEEAYFSQIDKGTIKAWKRHKKMTLNLVVPVGKIKFVIFDDRNKEGQFQEITISRDNYCRITVPPMVWFGFKGVSKGSSILLNIANMMHNTKEVERKNIKDIEFNWEN